MRRCLRSMVGWSYTRSSAFAVVPDRHHERRGGAHLFITKHARTLDAVGAKPLQWVIVERVRHASP
eukprot:8361500-Prorocentrum_lima.AAC.1